MGHLDKFVEMIKASRLLAPNLKTMTLRVYTGNLHTGNAVARDVVKKHLLALRWMNPNAIIYLRELKGQGTPEVEYSLWTSEEAKKFEIKGRLTPEEVIAKLMMAARDPFVEGSASATAEISTGTPSPASHTTVVTSASTGTASSVARRAYSTVSEARIAADEAALR